MKILKLIFIPYMGLGTFTAVAIEAARSGRGAWHPGLGTFAILAGIHVLLIGGAYYLAGWSRREVVRLSPSGMCIGLALAYGAGLLFPFFV